MSMSVPVRLRAATLVDTSPYAEVTNVPEDAPRPGGPRHSATLACFDTMNFAARARAKAPCSVG